MRDNQRSKVYKAERSAWAVYDENVMAYLSLDECQRFTNHIVRCYKSVYTLHNPIKVKDGRGRRTACADNIWTCGGVIKLPLWARTKTVILHEIAHHIAGFEEAHGRKFAKIYLELVNKYIGKFEGSILRRAYKECRVKYCSTKK